MKIREEYMTDPSRARSLKKSELILLVKQLQLELRKKRSAERETTNEDRIKLYAATHRIKTLKRKNSTLRKRIRELKKCDKRNCPTVLLWRNRLRSARINEKTASSTISRISTTLGRVKRMTEENGLLPA